MGGSEPSIEPLYLVDKNDQVLGSAERRKVHAEGLLHRSGMVFLIRSDGKLLIQHRSNSKQTFPGCYDSSAAFHVTYGETYEEAAARELKEETGVSAPLNYLGKFEHHDPPEHQMVAVFLCGSNSEVRADPSESTGFEFLTAEEIDRIVAKEKTTPWLRDGWKLARPKLRP